jgi:hypothetical protein
VFGAPSHDLHVENLVITPLSALFQALTRFKPPRRSWALALWYGTELIKKEGASFDDVLKVFLVIVSVGFGVAEAASLAPDVAKGGTATESVFEVGPYEIFFAFSLQLGISHESLKESTDVRQSP